MTLKKWTHWLKSPTGMLIFKILGSIIAILGLIISILSYNPKISINISGEWKLIDVIEKASFQDYIGNEIVFRMFLIQKNNEISGKAEKVSVNGTAIPFNEERTSLLITGTLNNDQTINAQFTEEGELRNTNGSFQWKLQDDNKILNGTFSSTASDTSGKSTAIKVDLL